MLISGQTVPTHSSWKGSILDIFLKSTGQKPLWGKNAGKIILEEINKTQKSYYNHSLKMASVYGPRLEGTMKKFKMAYDLGCWNLDF